MTDDDVPGAEAIDDDAVDEIVGRQRGERGVEGKHDGDIEPQPIEDRQLLRQRRQVEVRLLGMEILARVRLEDECAGRSAELAPDRRGGTQQRLVPAVHAVEIADGEHRTARFVGTFL